MTIQEILNNWKSEALFGERHFEKKTFSLIEGEELYLIAVKCNVTIGGQSKQIEKHKFFQTRVQGQFNPMEVNPRADEYICKQLLAKLESDFYTEYNNFIDEEVSKRSKL